MHWPKKPRYATIQHVRAVRLARHAIKLATRLMITARMPHMKDDVVRRRGTAAAWYMARSTSVVTRD